jgi:hypothetical protein
MTKRADGWRVTLVVKNASVPDVTLKVLPALAGQAVGSVAVSAKNIGK